MPDKLREKHARICFIVGTIGNKIGDPEIAYAGYETLMDEVIDALGIAEQMIDDARLAENKKSKAVE